MQVQAVGKVGFFSLLSLTGRQLPFVSSQSFSSAYTHLWCFFVCLKFPFIIRRPVSLD